jgi:hypothetical protein
MVDLAVGDLILAVDAVGVGGEQAPPLAKPGSLGTGSERDPVRFSC